MSGVGSNIASIKNYRLKYEQISWKRDQKSSWRPSYQLWNHFEPSLVSQGAGHQSCAGCVKCARRVSHWPRRVCPADDGPGTALAVTIKSILLTSPDIFDMGRYIGYGTGALNYAVQELFSRFTEQLSASAGLVNIAPHGRASQSSTSKWSRQHDAQRAVMDVDTEFAFHTDVEDEPWWHLEFDGLQHPEYIIISNRHRPEFQDLAETLRVEVSEDGTTWTLVHAGRVSFGASASGGLPLILPCRSQSPVRHIRLSLAERNPFHLSSVCVLAKQLVAPHRTGVTTFVANRSDGFGERLKSIVNAMALAHHFDGKFIVKWGRMSAKTPQATQLAAHLRYSPRNSPLIILAQ